MNISTDDINRFWSKVDKNGPVTDITLYGNIGNCWMWIPKYKCRYAFFSINGKNIRINRVSYIINNGDIPDKMSVCHKCDNDKCIRPDHLFIGTHQDNMVDRENKNRNKLQYGEEHGMSKLKNEDIINIRKQYKRHSKDNNIYTLAQKYDVHPTLIALIIKNKIWKHVQ